MCYEQITAFSCGHTTGIVAYGCPKGNAQDTPCELVDENSPKPITTSYCCGQDCCDRKVALANARCTFLQLHWLMHDVHFYFGEGTSNCEVATGVEPTRAD